MKKIFFMLCGCMLFLFTPVLTWAHFGMIIPSDDIVTQSDAKLLRLEVMFIHPMEGNYMDMEKPRAFGVLARGKKTDLLAGLRAKKVKGFQTWETTYKIKRPGDYVFYVAPRPYFEPAEDSFIIHYTKVIVDALGMQEGWDKPVGLETEIMPLTRPYGLWSGNSFSGQVLLNGEPVPGCDVEIEYYNKDGAIKPSSDPYVTQVVKADQNGVFTYTMPRAGWWGFAALNTSANKIKHNGVEKDVEIGAVLWVKTMDMQ